MNQQKGVFTSVRELNLSPRGLNLSPRGDAVSRGDEFAEFDANPYDEVMYAECK